MVLLLNFKAREEANPQMTAITRIRNTENEIHRIIVVLNKSIYDCLN